MNAAVRTKGWLEQVLDRDPQLAESIRNILTKLQTLSEAPAMSLEGGVSHGKPESSSPIGADLSGQNRCPKPERSLYEHYAYRLEHAPHDKKRRELVKLAEQALRWHRHGLPPERIAARAEADEKTDTQFVLEHCQGQPAGIVAAEGNWPPGWVKMVRMRAHQDPESGRPRPNWRELPDEQRRAICKDAAGRGLTQREAAVELGIGKGTISPYWPPTRRFRRAA